MNAFVTATRRLARRHEPGAWVGAIRQAFDAVSEQALHGIERFPPHYLVAVWEPIEQGGLLLPRWPAVAAIASPDAQAALLRLVSHVPTPARVWLTDEAVDWALVAEIVLRTDRHLAAYHRRELEAFIAACRKADAELIARTYTDRDEGFEALKSRLFGTPEA